jgi:hypothetical protein
MRRVFLLFLEIFVLCILYISHSKAHFIGKKIRKNVKSIVGISKTAEGGRQPASFARLGEKV